jgi:hypothetical protein
MAWYGVNFVLGVGLHTYGFGDGGQGFVYMAIFGQWLYAGVALHRSRPDVSRDDATITDGRSLISRPAAATSAAGGSLRR